MGLNTLKAQPVNTTCFNAIPLCPGVTYNNQSTGGSTSPTYPPISLWSCNGVLDGPVFYTFSTNAANDPVIIDITGSCTGNDIQAGIFQVSNTGPNCESGTWSSTGNCIQAPTSVTLNTGTSLQANTIYYLVIDNWPGQSCTFSINITGNASFSVPGIPSCCPVIPNAGPDVEICKGDSIILTATSTGGGTSYTWSPGGATTQSIKVSPDSTTKYTVSVSNGTCATTDEVIVKVTPTPSISLAPLNSLCIGDTVTVDATYNSNLFIDDVISFTNPQRIPINNLDTTFSEIEVSGITGNITSTSVVSVCMNIIHPNDADLDIFLICPDGTQLALSTDNGGTGNDFTNTCFTATALQNITSGTAPFSANYLPEGTGGLSSFSGCNANGIWKLAIYDDATSNIGELSDWTITINNKYKDSVLTYSWTPSGFISDTAIAEPKLFPVTTTKYFITTTNAKGCSKTDSIEVIINPLPTVDAGNDTSICKGTSATLIVQGAQNYIWSPVTDLDNSTSDTVIATPLTPTTYFVQGTDSNGCVSFDTVSITIKTPPVVQTDAEEKIICFGDSIQLSATGAANFTWFPVIGLNNPNITDPKAAPITTTTYIATGTDPNGCFNIDSTKVVVIPQFIVDAGADTSMCVGDNIQLHATGAMTYSWTPTTGLSDPNIANPIASPSVTEKYVVTGTDENGCVSRDTIEIVVSNKPVVTISPEQTICQGDSIQLTATGGVSYAWTPEHGLNSDSISNPMASPLFTTNYSVKIDNGSGCLQTLSVKVNVLSTPTANAGLDAAICDGSSIGLNATGGVSYSWEPAAGLSSTTSSSPIATPVITTEYVVTVTGINGCSEKDSVLVSVNNSPLTLTSTSTDAKCFGSSDGAAAVYVSGGSGNYNYFWTPGFYTSDSISILKAGTYSVMVIDANSQCKDSIEIEIKQPANFIINTSATNATCVNPGNATVSVSGSSVFTYTWNSSPVQNSATATNLAPGQYIITVSDSNDCVKKDTVQIILNDGIVADFNASVVSGDAPLNVTFTNLSNGATTFLWTFADGTTSGSENPTHTFINPGLYEVMLKITNGSCISYKSLSISVTEKLLYNIPNVFTPNGDNSNDIFTFNGSGMGNFSCQIFNRWGQKVYEWLDQKGGWDGGSHEPGVYYFILNFEPANQEKKTISGFVSLFK